MVPSLSGSSDNSYENVNKQMERMKIDSHLENRIDEHFHPPENLNKDDIKITVNDMSEHDDFGAEMKIHDDVFNPNIDTSDESQFDRLKRDVISANYEAESVEEKITYRSLGSPHLSQPIRVQMWLNIEKARFTPRLNPQCVRWHTFNNQWTRIGCHTELPDFEKVQYDGNGLILINCTCTHVSSYAVLIDVIDPEDIPDPSLLVQITSFSAFVVSLPILFCVIIALALLRGLQTNSNTIHQNLVFCIFLAELLFFIAWQARRSLIENDVSFQFHQHINFN
jgi:cadherin EGF LAG seven-pass G-type receptor 1